MRIEFVSSLKQIKSVRGLYICLPAKDGALSFDHFYDCWAALDGVASIITAPFEESGYFQMAYLGQEGIFRQSACFLPERFSEITAGDDLTVIETRHGRIALAAGLDILQPQYGRLAALRGAQLLVAGLWLEDEDALMTGAWSAAQANCLPVACARPGGGSLILPCAMTKDNSGFGRSEFSPEELKAAHSEFPVFDSLNCAFYSRYREELLR